MSRSREMDAFSNPLPEESGLSGGKKLVLSQRSRFLQFITVMTFGGAAILSGQGTGNLKGSQGGEKTDSHQPDNWITYPFVNSRGDQFFVRCGTGERPVDAPPPGGSSSFEGPGVIILKTDLNDPSMACDDDNNGRTRREAEWGWWQIIDPQDSTDNGS